MKSRSGFVSNSSSTSFYCYACGKKDELLGDCDPSDNDMICCERGHEVHISCLNDYQKAYYTNKYDENRKNYIPIKDCPICNLWIVPRRDLIRYVLATQDIKEIEKEIKVTYKTHDCLLDYLKSRRVHEI